MKKKVMPISPTTLTASTVLYRVTNDAVRFDCFCLFPLLRTANLLDFQAPVRDRGGRLRPAGESRRRAAGGDDQRRERRRQDGGDEIDHAVPGRRQQVVALGLQSGHRADPRGVAAARELRQRNHRAQRQLVALRQIHADLLQKVSQNAAVATVGTAGATSWLSFSLRLHGWISRRCFPVFFLPRTDHRFGSPDDFHLKKNHSLHRSNWNEQSFEQDIKWNSIYFYKKMNF